MRDDYVRTATLVEVIDGDTARLDVDLGFYVRVRLSCRLAGLNTPERTEPGGPEARTALALLLGSGTLTVRSVKPDKYAGRFDANVLVTTGKTSIDVNAWMIAQGYAVPWSGIGAKPPVPWPRVIAA